MSLLLCHTCFTWAEPISGRCPECFDVLDSSHPDPSLDHLNSVIGPLVVRVGTVRVERRLLPDRGTLYCTRRGFYFLPHQIEHRSNVTNAASPGQSLLWSAATLLFFPLMFLGPFLWIRRYRETTSPVFHPQYLSDSDSDRMARLLMEHPGVFFIPRESIRSISRRRSRWTIIRQHGVPCRLSPETAARQLHDRMDHIARNWPSDKADMLHHSDNDAGGS